MAQKTPKLKFKPRVGDVVFTRHDTIGSWTLRILNGSFGYHHACIIGESINGRPTIYTTGAVKLRKISYRFGQVDAAEYLVDKDYVVCRYRNAQGKGLTKHQKAAIIEWCREHKGKRYGFRKAWKYFYTGLDGKGIDHAEVPGLEDHVFCYEAVASAYERAGIILNARAKNLHPSGYDAKELYFSPGFKDVFEFARPAS